MERNDEQIAHQAADCPYGVLANESSRAKNSGEK